MCDAMKPFEWTDRFINVGIMEQTAVNVAAGLALGGKRPFVFGIAAFLVSRAFDQIRCNLNDMNLPVVLIGSGGGLDYGSDGSSHHALYDVELIKNLPRFSIWNISSPTEAVEALELASRGLSPAYLRLNKGKLPETYGKYVDPHHYPFEVRR